MRYGLLAAVIAACVSLAPVSAATIDSEKLRVEVVYYPDNQGRGHSAIMQTLWRNDYLAGLKTTGAFVDADTGKEYGLVLSNKTSDTVFACISIDGLLVASTSGKRTQPSVSQMENFAKWVSPPGENDHGCREIEPNSKILIRQHAHNQLALKFRPAGDSRASKLEASDPLLRYYNMPVGTISIAVFTAFSEPDLTEGRARSLGTGNTRGATGTGSGGYVGDPLARNSDKDANRIAEMIFIRYEDTAGPNFIRLRDDELRFSHERAR